MRSLLNFGVLLGALVLSGCATTMQSAKEFYSSVTYQDHRREYTSDKPVVLFILDTSGSMQEMNGGETRLDIAKKSIIDSIGQIDRDRYNTGLITFNKFLACKADVAVEPGNDDPDKVVNRIQAVEARGNTPLAEAIKLSGEILKNVDKKLVILFSDGDETCSGFPEHAAAELAAKHGIKLNMQVIGYSVDRQTEQRLQRIASAGQNWGYHRVENQASLAQAINTITTQAGVLDPIWQDIGTSSFEFSPGSVVLGREYSDILNKVYLFLKHNKKNIVVIGHTDATGGADYNLKLSLDRALIVKNELVKMGIADYRIATDGRGEYEPVASNDSEVGRRKNRRVVIKVVD